MDEVSVKTNSPAPPPGIAQDIVQRLSDDIIYGVFAPGERIAELDLAERYGASRSPVREAMYVLEQEGLVVREGRRGVTVAPIGTDNINNLYCCRLKLEGLALDQAARRIADKEIQQCRTLLSEMERAFESRDVEMYFECNIRLWAIYHGATNNPTLIRLLKGISKQALRYRFLAYTNVPTLMELSIAGHREIVAALVSRDPLAAGMATEDLIRKSWRLILERFRDDVESLP